MESIYEKVKRYDLLKERIYDNPIIFNSVELPDRDLIRFSCSKFQIQKIITNALNSGVTIRTINKYTDSPQIELILDESNYDSVIKFGNWLIDLDKENYKKLKERKKEMLLLEPLIIKNMQSILNNLDEKTQESVKKSKVVSFKEIMISPNKNFKRFIKRIEKYYNNKKE